jgi:prepilin-type N-terminal cleavage/methylation domain-containing protein
MNKRTPGFTLVELLIVIAILGFVLAGTSQMFVSILKSYRQQSRITETNVEGIIGLELLRQDLGKTGYGLPWNGLTTYTEVAPGNYSFAISLNDASNAPRGIVSVNNVVAGSTNVLDGTDYLAIKATNIATNDASGKWMFLSPGVAGGPISWGTPTTTEDLIGTDRVIVLSPGTPGSPVTARTLIISGGLFYSQLSAVANFADTSVYNETRLIYGVDPSHSLSRPFNRADYYIARPSSGMPQRCAAGTGILYKAVLDQGDGNFGPPMPLLDCVADMQVIFRWDALGDGVLQPINDISGLSGGAQDVRDKVKEVRVYILAHEGQKDNNYTQQQNPIPVGTEFGVSLGRSFDLSAHGITNWQNYRWKLYTLVVELENLQ